MQKKHNLDEIHSPSGLTIYHKGPDLQSGPLPALYYFALSGKDSLTLDPFNQPVNFLDNFPIRIFSFDIPGHGDGLENTKAIGYWARQLAEGNNIINKFIDDSVNNVNFIIENGWVDTEHMAAAGISRGGFISFHIAAKHTKINNILAFAPLILLSKSEEFKELENDPIVQELNVTNLIPQLVHKHVRCYIGNRDVRVGTDRCFDFIESLTETAFQQGVRSPQVELIISPSIGHKGHGTPPHIFRDGAEWLKSRLKK